MTLPIVTELTKALEPVERDTFIERLERPVATSEWQLPRRRPADA